MIRLTLQQAKQCVEALKRRRVKCPLCVLAGVTRFLSPSLIHRAKPAKAEPGWRDVVLGPQLRLTCSRGCGYGEMVDVSE